MHYSQAIGDHVREPAISKDIYDINWQAFGINRFKSAHCGPTYTATGAMFVDQDISGVRLQNGLRDILVRLYAVPVV